MQKIKGRKLTIFFNVVVCARAKIFIAQYTVRQRWVCVANTFNEIGQRAYFTERARTMPDTFIKEALLWHFSHLNLSERPASRSAWRHNGTLPHAYTHTRAFFSNCGLCKSFVFIYFVYTRRVRGLNSHSQQGLSHCQFFFLVLRLRRCCKANRVFWSDAAPLPRMMMTTADNLIGSKVPSFSGVNNPIKIQLFYWVCCLKRRHLWNALIH